MRTKLTKILLICFAVSFFGACASELAEHNGTIDSPARDILNTMYSQSDKMSTFDLTLDNTDSSSRNRIVPSNLPLYVVVPADLNPKQNLEVVEQFHQAKCTAELVEIAERTGSILTTEYADDVNLVLQIPESKAREALKPLVESSRKFLHSKGFTDQEINSMLAENMADETDLIRLALYITNDEYHQNSVAQAKAKPGFNVLDLFATKAYAGTPKNDYWELVGDCFITCLLIDFRSFAGNSTATKWTKVAIRIAFRNIAKKMLGPVGVAIATVEFFACVKGVDLLRSTVSKNIVPSRS